MTCPLLRDKPWKRGLIPDIPFSLHGVEGKVFSVGDGLASYQLVGGVMAYQGVDG